MVEVEQSAIDDEELKRIVEQMKVNIKVIGCGGGGSNTINRCNEVGVCGADLIAMNTDAKHLLSVHAGRKILIGKKTTRGLGAGALPEVGEAATKENLDDVKNLFKDTNIAFITAGMGGGTGTGSAHMVAKCAKDAGALTMGVVTMPFSGEGVKRWENAAEGLEKLRRVCDTTIVVPNDKLLELVPKLPIEAAFKVADEVLMQTIKGLTEIITKPGLVNLDYGDIQTVMKDGGVAVVGIGESDEATDRVSNAMNQAITSPLLGRFDLGEAKGVLVRVVGGPEMTLAEAEKAAEIVHKKVNPNARIIWGCSVEPEMKGRIRTLIIATGIKSDYILGKETRKVGIPIAGTVIKKNVDIDYLG